MKYKVGDKVKIKSLSWYNKHKNHIGIIQNFVEPMSIYCGKDATITKIVGGVYELDIDDGKWNWCDYMFKTKTFKKENCNLRERAEITDMFGNKIVLSGRHAFEWSITTYKENGITRIVFGCRKDAKKRV